MVSANVAAYELTRSYYRNDLFESWFNGRVDYPDFNTVLTGGVSTIKLTGSSLDGGRYTVPLGPAPGVGIISEEDPDPDVILYVGPIQQNGATVGRFEVLCDDRVVIRDEAKSIVQVH